MARRMLFLFIIHIIVLLILLNSIPQVYSKDCWIKRYKRDRIIIPMDKTFCTPSNNPCSKFGGVLELTERECICICPANNQTYMETTNKCTSYSDVQSSTGCNLSFQGLTTIPIFSKSLRLNIPKKFKRCRMAANRKKSFYLTGSGWSRIPQSYEFPFLVQTVFRRGRPYSAYVKVTTNVPPELIGKVFRLGISCRRKSDCITFKIPGKILDQCMLPTTPANPTSSSSTSFPLFTSKASPIPISTIPTRKITIISQPSASNKNSRESSSVKIPWSVIGAIIGILIALSLGIIILAVCFWRRRSKSSRKNQAGNASARSSGVTLSSTESQPEVTYSSPHHPYQELKPLPSGTPRGVYQPLKWTGREDISGYMLPSDSKANNQPDPLYNEIGSPTRPLPVPPVYDYALPENTVRISNHLSNIDLSKINGSSKPDARNDPDYVGRTSKDQEEPKSPSSEGAAPAPVNDDPTSPVYLDFNSEGANRAESSECKSPDNGGTKMLPGLSTRYKKPMNGYRKSPSEERPYSVLEPPTSPVCRPLRLSRENLHDADNKESSA